MFFLSKLALLCVLAGSLILAGFAPAQISPTDPVTVKPEPKPTYWEANGCKNVVTKDQYRKALRRVYRFSHTKGDYRASRVTRRQRLKLAKLRACSFDRKVHRKRLKRTLERKKNHAFHAYIDRITPFGPYAIPSYIVFRESRYNPRAKNGESTAGGFYQFIDSTWYAFGGRRYNCYHVAACAPIWEQHVVASRAWADGSHHWALTR